MARYSFTQLMDLWVQQGGSKLYAPMAAAIAMAESGGNSNAINGNNRNGTIDRGLWQINSIHGAQSTLDPQANARAAVAISKGGTDWRPWCVAWSNGACGGTFLGSGAPVLRYLPGGTNTGNVPTDGTSNPVTADSPSGLFGQLLQAIFSPVQNLFGNPIQEAASQLARTIGTSIRLYLYYVACVIFGAFLLVVGVILLILSTRTVRTSVGEVSSASRAGFGSTLGARAASGGGGRGPEPWTPLPIEPAPAPPTSAPPASAPPVSPPPAAPPAAPPPKPYKPRHQMMVQPEGGEVFRAGAPGKRKRARAAVAGKDVAADMPGRDITFVDTLVTKGYKGRHSR